jgi:hypothetical protein
MTSNPTQGVIGEAWEHYKSHWQHLIGIALLIYVVVGLISYLLILALGFVGALLAVVVSLVGAFLTQGALAKAIQDLLDGHVDMGFGETLAAARPYLGRIAGASILAGLGIAFGLILFIIPGLVLLTWWSLITPVIVFENSGAVESLGRSRRLVSGWAWQVFGVFLLMFLLLIGFGILLGVVLLPLPDDVAQFVSDALGGAITAPFIALVAIILYNRLRGLEVPAGTAPPMGPGTTPTTPDAPTTPTTTTPAPPTTPPPSA